MPETCEPEVHTFGLINEECYLCGMSLRDANTQAANRIAELERQNAAAMAIVRAVADLILYAHDDGDLYDTKSVAKIRDQARALLAGETPPSE